MNNHIIKKANGFTNKILHQHLQDSLKSNIRFFFTILLVSLSFWILESVGDNLFIEKYSYQDAFSLMINTKNDMHLVIVVIACLIIGGVYSQFVHVINKKNESENRYKLVFEKMINGFFIFEPVYGEDGHLIDMRYVEANPSYEKQTRFKISEILGKTWSEKTLVSKDEFHKLICLYEEILTTGKSQSYEIQTAIEDAHYLVTAFKMSDRAIGVMFQNITNYKKALADIHQLNTHLEQRVEERTKSLLEVISELEGFAYTVSHDLKVPLRIINRYANGIAEDSEIKMSPKTNEAVSQIRTISQDMMEMVNKLLEYSATSTLKVDKDIINVNEMINQIFNELKANSYKRDIELNILSQLPIVLADKVLMKNVLYNILSNSFKFTRNRNQAMIEVGCICKKDEYVFFIRDNGVGFETEYAGKLFGMFQRLHTTEEFEGSGIGLATIRKIIEKHKGRTWMEGKEGEGATIYFSLPYETVE